MGSFGEYLAGIGRSIVTLGDGLAVTFSYLLRKPFTIQYPDRTEKPVVAMLPERSRGILEIDLDACTGCTMCAKQCPIDCIHIEVVKDEETKKRMIKRFDIDVAKCMYCGLCVEACPVSGLRHTKEFEGSVGDVRRLMLSFATKPQPVAKPPKKGEPKPETKPVGSIVREMLADQWKPGGSP
jgi:formate hydrogenlyase subunit 6/NADH:ubiquinone oxidoreductase subunit I